MKLDSRLICCCFAALLPLFSGCTDQQELAGNLNTHQSVELVVALKGVGITPSRERTSGGRESRYSVSVGSADYLRSLQVMHEYRLPSEHSEQFNELTSPQGLMPNTPEMNRLRLDRALGLEVERVISSLPGVLDVKAVVRSSLLAGNETPTVALVLRYLSPSGNMPFAADDVKKIVMRTVPGTSADSISLNSSRVFFPVSTGADAILVEGDATGSNAAYIQLRPFPFRVVASERLKSYAQIGTLLLGATLSGIILGAAVVLSSRKQSRRRRTPSAGSRGMVPEVVTRPPPPAGPEFSETLRRRNTES